MIYVILALMAAIGFYFAPAQTLALIGVGFLMYVYPASILLFLLAMGVGFFLFNK